LDRKAPFTEGVQGKQADRSREVHRLRKTSKIFWGRGLDGLGKWGILENGLGVV
jgi:hypothetical protein